jgi:hypothetical protein
MAASRVGLPSYNATDHGMTVRPSSTSLLCIDSEDRYVSYNASRVGTISPYNYTINKSESLMNGFMTRVGVTEISFPWLIPNVNVKTRDIIVTTTIGAGAPVITPIRLDIGMYIPSQLVLAIDAAVSQAVPGLGLTIDYGAPGTFSDRPIVTYSVTAGNTIAFSPLPYNSATYPFGSQTKQLFDILGFTAANTVPLVSGNGNYTLCQAIRYVDIVCPQLTYNQALKDTMSQSVVRDTLCRLYLNSAPGISSTTIPSDGGFCPPGCAPTVLYKEYTHPKQIQWLPNQPIPGYLQIQVYDDTGDLLDNSLTNIESLAGTSQATDWSMTLQISEC